MFGFDTGGVSLGNQETSLFSVIFLLYDKVPLKGIGVSTIVGYVMEDTLILVTDAPMVQCSHHSL